MEKKGRVSPAKRVMLWGLWGGAAGCCLCGLWYRLGGPGWCLGAAITCGMVAYHMLVRFLSAAVLALLTGGRYRYTCWWFRQRRWEPGLYRRLGVKRWKTRLPAYDPGEFSLGERTAGEVICSMCHAELVHEAAALLSLLSVLFAIPFGDFWLFALTAVLSAGFECVFIIAQRYNRPRLVRLAQRRGRSIKL